MKNFFTIIIVALCLFFAYKYFNRKIGIDAIDQKLIYLEQYSIAHGEDIDSIKNELRKISLKIENQSSKIDTVIFYNREIVKSMKSNHDELKEILSQAIKGLTNILSK